ncbi:MAG TPA: hypothetical protein VHV51_13225, partial [Polyangiaceae bacterium]|nr:hypothetical protein [Polyangiaceae bacterium]
NMGCVSPNVSACDRSLARRRGLALLFALLGVARQLAAQEPDAAAPSATAPNADELKNRCADAYESAQRERASGHLLLAREQAIFCAQEHCPALLRDDCVNWTEQLAQSVPKLVLEARGAHREALFAVRVSVDGKPLVDVLDGRERELDPGPHHLRFEAEHYVPVERDVLLVQGGEPTRVVVDLQPVAPPPRPAWKPPISSFVFAGVGLLSLGSFAYFGISGNQRKNRLDSDGCSPACDPTLKAPIERDYAIADASLGVALISFGVSSWLLVTSRHRAEQTVYATPTRGGGLLGYRARF